MIYIYVKIHKHTNLHYLGKTTQNPYKYYGSGKHWLRHIKKHGNHVDTYVLAEFYDQEIDVCTSYALSISKHFDVVNSPDWANLIEENGLDGKPSGSKGHKFTSEQRQQLSEINKKRWQNPEYRARMQDKHKKRWTDEMKQSQSERLTGVKRPEHSKIMKTKDVSHLKRSGPQTEEHKKKISIALKRYHSSCNK